MRIHIHANCQSVPLAGLLHEVYPDWTITYYEVHAQPIIDEPDNYRHCVRSADVILAQPIHPGYRGRDDLTIDWIRQNARSSQTVIVIPSVHFAAHQASWEVEPFPGFDLLAAHLVASGFKAREAVTQLLSPSLLTDAEIEREIGAAIAEAHRRELEDRIDVPYTPFLESNAHLRLLCHFSNHPLRETMVFVANEILKRLGYAARIPLDGRDYQADVHIPPLPAVTQYLTARGEMPNSHFYSHVWLHGMPPMPIADYYTAMIDRLMTIPAHELVADIARRWPTIELLRRLAAHDSAIPGVARWKAPS